VPDSLTEPRDQRAERRSAGRRASPTLIPLAVAVAVGALLTLLVSVLPSLRFAYRSETAHGMIETAAFLVGGLAATLVAGRALRRASRNALLLAAALAVLALTNLVFALVATLADWSRGFETWGGMAGRIVGAALFATAALLPERRLARPARAIAGAGAAVVATLAVLALVAALVGDDLRTGIDPTLSPEGAERPRVVGSVGVLAGQGLLIALYVAAAAGFARGALRGGDRLLGGFAVAAVLAAFARVNYFLFPSLYSQWVYTGDVLRLAQFLVILAVVLRELLEYQRRAAVVAVLDERRRVARELHDGLAQELAFIRAETRRLGSGAADAIATLVSAADRALEESRAAIATLNRPLDEPLVDMLRASAEAVALRAGACVVTEDGGGGHVAPDVRHALSRIVREATANAVRHGDARTITLRVGGPRELRVEIVDDGRGFDVERDVRADAYGLVGMRERAEALGGRLTVRSEPGRGTTVEVVLP
jgi:signal transduction histidine kinase